MRGMGKGGEEKMDAEGREEKVGVGDCWENGVGM